MLTSSLLHSSFLVLTLAPTLRTVFENVAFGLLGAEQSSLPKADQRALVEKACKAAYADEFIERLPKGYDTQVGERAMMLSGGQVSVDSFDTKFIELRPSVETTTCHCSQYRFGP